MLVFTCSGGEQHDDAFDEALVIRPISNGARGRSGEAGEDARELLSRAEAELVDHVKRGMRRIAKPEVTAQHAGTMDDDTR